MLSLEAHCLLGLLQQHLQHVLREFALLHQRLEVVLERVREVHLLLENVHDLPNHGLLAPVVQRCALELRLGGQGVCLLFLQKGQALVLLLLDLLVELRLQGSLALHLLLFLNVGRFLAAVRAPVKIRLLSAIFFCRLFLKKLLLLAELLRQLQVEALLLLLDLGAALKLAELLVEEAE